MADEGERIDSAEEVIVSLERILALSELGELTPATLETAAGGLLSFLRRLPDRETELVALSSAFERGAEELRGTLISYDYHPQSTGLWNPYEHELSELRYNRDREAEGWISADELLSEDFEIPEGMEIEWDQRLPSFSKWGRLVTASEPEAQFYPRYQNAESRLGARTNGW